MSDTTTKELAACLGYARVVARVLPVDDDVDAAIARVLNVRPARRPARKLRP